MGFFRILMDLSLSPHRIPYPPKNINAKPGAGLAFAYGRAVLRAGLDAHIQPQKRQADEGIGPCPIRRIYSVPAGRRMADRGLE